MDGLIHFPTLLVIFAMEYKGATIAALVIFGMLFVGALLMTQPDSNENDERKSIKVVGTIPDPQPNKMDDDADTEYTVLPSGVKYKILRKSDKKKATPENAVAVAYKGWTKGGQVFDSSYGRTKPYIAVNPPWGVIEGWKQVLPLLGEGGMMEVEIPAELAYGSQDKGAIKGGSTLWFKMEILKVFDK